MTEIYVFEVRWTKINTFTSN